MKTLDNVTNEHKVSGMMNCEICGKPESEHHEFEAALTLPTGCVCDAGTWGGCQNGVTPICDKFIGGRDAYCETCEHDWLCHDLYDADALAIIRVI